METNGRDRLDRWTGSWPRWSGAAARAVGRIPGPGPGCGLGVGEHEGERARGRGPWADLPVRPKTVKETSQFFFFSFSSKSFISWKMDKWLKENRKEIFLVGKIH